MSSGNESGLLQTALSVAVPLWIFDLRTKPFAYVLERAEVCSQVIAEKGDIILFRSKKRGQTAEAFNRLAEGLACLSFFPGGVKAFGCHFEAEHPEASQIDGSERLSR